MDNVEHKCVVFKTTLLYNPHLKSTFNRQLDVYLPVAYTVAVFPVSLIKPILKAKCP